MAEQIKQEFNVSAELIKGTGGVFDVVADGTLVFSKKQAGRFPENEEVLQSLSRLAG